MPSKKKVFKNGLRDGVAGKYTKKVTHLSLQDIAMKPAYNTTRTYTPEPPVPQAPSHQRDVWVPANPYLTAEIPRWLKIYSRASPEFDDQLKWELFRLSELEGFQAMMNRLHRQELEELVMYYEAYRTSLAAHILKVQ